MTPRVNEHVERNARIYWDKLRFGESNKALARRYGVTGERIRVILLNERLRRRHDRRVWEHKQLDPLVSLCIRQIEADEAERVRQQEAADRAERRMRWPWGRA